MNKKGLEGKTCKEESWFSRDSRASEIFKSLSISSCSCSSSSSLSVTSCSGRPLVELVLALWMQLLILNLSSVAFASTNPIPSSSIFSLSVTVCVWERVCIGLKVLKEINAEVCLCLSVFRVVSRGKSTAEAPKENEQSCGSVSVPWDFLYFWLSDCGALSLDMDYHSLFIVFIVKGVQLPSRLS